MLSPLVQIFFFFFTSSHRQGHYTYSLTCLAVLLEVLMHFWLASPTTVWNLDSVTIVKACRYTYVAAWLLLVHRLLTLDHLEMLGFTQVRAIVQSILLRVSFSFEPLIFACRL